MSKELVIKPVRTLEEIKAGIESEADIFSNRADFYFERNPETVGAEGVEHSPGATNKRMADVYQNTSEQIGVVILQHKRNLIRAINPLYSTLNDEEVDKKVKEWEDLGRFA